MVQDYWRTTDENTPGGFQLLVAVGGVVQHWQRINTDIATNEPKAGGESLSFLPAHFLVFLHFQRIEADR